jgi:hypothetical protein
MNQFPKFEIKLDPSPMKCSVKMDGVDISGKVYAVRIEKAKPTEIPTVTITYFASEVGIEVRAEASPLPEDEQHG